MATQQLYFFSEDSTVPNSTEYSEGRALLEKAAYNTTQEESFVADHLRKVDVFKHDRVPKHSQIIQLAKDSAFIEALK